MLVYLIVLLWIYPAGSLSDASIDNAEVHSLSDASEIFVLGNIGFALLHEFGHAIIRDFDVPLLGLEENSADTIAATTLVLLDRQHPEIELNVALGVTALVQSFVWKTGMEREQADVAMWAQHGLSAQRFARLACLLYGSDPVRFGWVAEASQMNEYRADSCEDEWRIAEHAAHWLRDTYGAAPEGESAPESRVSIRYESPDGATDTVMLALMQRTSFLERLVSVVEQRVHFPAPLELVVEYCDSPNAYWDPENRQVVLCYELISAFARVADREEVSRLVERFRAAR